MTAWFGGFYCGCTDLQPAVQQVHAKCPDHGARLILSPELTTVAEGHLRYGVEPTGAPRA